MQQGFVATYRGAGYPANIGPGNGDVVLFSDTEPPADHGFERGPAFWLKHVDRAELSALDYVRTVGEYRGERCLVVGDRGDRLHIAYLGHDAPHAEELGYWMVDRGAYEVVVGRDEVIDITTERVPHPVGPGGAQVPAPAATGAPTGEGPVDVPVARSYADTPRDDRLVSDDLVGDDGIPTWDRPERGDPQRSAERQTVAALNGHGPAPRHLESYGNGAALDDGLDHGGRTGGFGTENDFGSGRGHDPGTGQGYGTGTGPGFGSGTGAGPGFGSASGFGPGQDFGAGSEFGAGGEPGFGSGNGTGAGPAFGADNGLGAGGEQSFGTGPAHDFGAGNGTGPSTANDQGFAPGAGQDFRSGLDRGFGAGADQGFGPGTDQGFGAGTGFDSGPAGGFGPGMGNDPGAGPGMGPGAGNEQGFNPGAGQDFGSGPNPDFASGPHRGFDASPRHGFDPAAGQGYGGGPGEGFESGPGQDPGAGQGFGPGADANAGRGFGPGTEQGYGPGTEQGFGPGGEQGFGAGTGAEQGFGAGPGNEGFGPGAGPGAPSDTPPTGTPRHGFPGGGQDDAYGAATTPFPDARSVPAEDGPDQGGRFGDMVEDTAGALAGPRNTTSGPQPVPGMPPPPEPAEDGWRAASGEPFASRGTGRPDAPGGFAENPPAGPGFGDAPSGPDAFRDVPGGPGAFGDAPTPGAAGTGGFGDAPGGPNAFGGAAGPGAFHDAPAGRPGEYGDGPGAPGGAFGDPNAPGGRGPGGFDGQGGTGALGDPAGSHGTGGFGEGQGGLGDPNNPGARGTGPGGFGEGQGDLGDPNSSGARGTGPGGFGDPGVPGMPGDRPGGPAGPGFADAPGGPNAFDDARGAPAAYGAGPGLGDAERPAPGMPSGPQGGLGDAPGIGAHGGPSRDAAGPDEGSSWASAPLSAPVPETYADELPAWARDSEPRPGDSADDADLRALRDLGRPQNGRPQGPAGQEPLESTQTWTPVWDDDEHDRPTGREPASGAYPVSDARSGAYPSQDVASGAYPAPGAGQDAPSGAYPAPGTVPGQDAPSGAYPAGPETAGGAYPVNPETGPGRDFGTGPNALAQPGAPSPQAPGADAPAGYGPVPADPARSPRTTDSWAFDPDTGTVHRGGLVPDTARTNAFEQAAGHVPPTGWEDAQPVAYGSHEPEPPTQPQPEDQARISPRWTFGDLVSRAGIPEGEYAIEEEVDGAFCLVTADDGFDVFYSEHGGRHNLQHFDDEQAAFYYLFGRIAAVALRSGRLTPPR